MASRTTTSTPKSSNVSSVSKTKPKKKNLFKCWGKKPPPDLPKTFSESSIAPPYDDSKVEDKAVSTGDIQKIPKKDAASQGDQNQENKAKKGDSGKLNRKGKGKGDGKNSGTDVCQKCSKKKQDKDSSQHKKDNPSCKCKSRGYCNTNTIIFPNDYKQPRSFESQENKYLELLKEIIKDETRKSCTDMTEFRREMDRQREEIRELKALVLQSLLSSNSNNCNNNDNKDPTNNSSNDEKGETNKNDNNKKQNAKIRSNSETTLQPIRNNRHATSQTRKTRSDSRESIDTSVISKTKGKPTVPKKNKTHPEKKSFFSTWLAGDY